MSGLALPSVVGPNDEKGATSSNADVEGGAEAKEMVALWPWPTASHSVLQGFRVLGF